MFAKNGNGSEEAAREVTCNITVKRISPRLIVSWEGEEEKIE
jgi:hypothetical protein